MSGDHVNGYGRYADDPSHIGCPRANSDMTPCTARDGRSADQDGVCVGCGVSSADAFAELVRHVTDENASRIAELEALRTAGNALAKRLWRGGGDLAEMIAAVAAWEEACRER